MEVGDKAAPLKIQQWIVGDAVTPDKPDGKTAYVVEFWATWCGPCRQTIPHLNALHDKYKDQGLKIVGVSDEDVATIRPFAKQMNMRYAVAADNKGATTKAYRAGEGGIPHAYVIDKKGVVVWQGHPMAGLDTVVAQVLAGSFDADMARKVGEQEAAFQQAAQRNDLEGALDASRKLMALQPESYDRVEMVARLLAYKQDKQAIRALRTEAAQRFSDNADSLEALANGILANPDVELRDPALGLQCAEKAVQLTGRENAGALATLASAYYALCLIDKAIATQRQAIAKARDGELKAALGKTLAYYEQIRSLRQQTEQ